MKRQLTPQAKFSPLMLPWTTVFGVFFHTIAGKASGFYDYPWDIPQSQIFAIFAAKNSWKTFHNYAILHCLSFLTSHISSSRCVAQRVQEIRRDHPPIMHQKAPKWCRACRKNKQKKIKFKTYRFCKNKIFKLLMRALNQ